MEQGWFVVSKNVLEGREWAVEWGSDWANGDVNAGDATTILEETVKALAALNLDPIEFQQAIMKAFSSLAE